MRRAALVCLGLAALLAVLAWWGLSTTAGRQSFGERMEVIPVAAGVLSALLTICGTITWSFSGRRG